MTTTRTVLVTGATGQQGGAVASALLDRGHRVRAFTRRPDAAAALAARGAEIATGDFTRPDSLTAAAKGVDTVFLMSDSWSGGVAAETANGIAAVDALKAAAPAHVIYTSVASADRKTGIPHFDSKFAVEERLAASGLRYTIVAPVAFMDNHLAPWSVPALAGGTLAMALPPDRKVQQVAVADIGRFVAELVERREAVFGKRIEIAGDDVDGDAMARTIAGAAGRPIAYLALPNAVLRQQNEEAAIMFEWFERVGYRVDLAALRRDWPKVGWQSFADWASTVDWSVLDRAEAAE